MKQQYILKLILVRGISFKFVQYRYEYPVSMWICCYMLHICTDTSCFGYSKMVTECELKPISMNFGSPRTQGRGGLCVEGMVQD